MPIEYQEVSSNSHLKVLFPMIVANRNHRPEFIMGKFDAYVSQNLNEICKQLNTRWLVSICDTYVIGGTDIQSLIALNIIQMVNQPKFFLTYFAKRPNMADFQWSKELWDGVIVFNMKDRGGNNNMHLEDTFKNMFSRMSSRIQKDPTLFKIYKTIMIRMEESEHFKEYKKFIK